MHTLALNKISKNDYFKRKIDSNKIYKKSHYDRSTKTFSCFNVDDINNEIFIKSNKIVFTGFTY